ncbi:hypothetical protein NDU88_000789 [Pleurodeles waltl]|uniref:Uncharacterized protein n=1 Tax=Pleurodeles waltl TaxID=8319 RepID=A0AAV7Q1B1_PLEWA|nr:hypothetical protein NDU88_000789 [Pleurodeles waltl]
MLGSPPGYSAPQDEDVRLDGCLSGASPTCALEASGRGSHLSGGPRYARLVTRLQRSSGRGSWVGRMPFWGQPDMRTRGFWKGPSPIGRAPICSTRRPVTSLLRTRMLGWMDAFLGPARHVL